MQWSRDELRALELQYNARKPMLSHIAAAVRSELHEFLEDEGFVTGVEHSVLSDTQFGQLVQKTHLPKPLVQLTSQVSLRVITNDVEQIEAIREAIQTHYHSVQAGWKDDDSQLTLRFNIPSQAKPGGYRDRSDVPNLMELTIAASQALPRITADGDEVPKLALVMKGGGIKGLAYVGALEYLRDEYKFNWYVGTSAGAITAILLAVGYEVEELQEILETKKFKDFFDAPFYKQPYNLITKKGLHTAKAFTDWMDELLSSKFDRKPTRVTLGDIQARTGNRVTVYASQQREKVLTFDSENTPEAHAAYAARCSMSIPILFTPETNQGIVAFDGGLQNNFPIRQLREDHGEIPFVSLFLGSEKYEPVKDQTIFFRLIDIWTRQGEDQYVDEFIDHTSVIDPSPVGTLDFDVDASEKKYLVICGRIGALKHLYSEEDRPLLLELQEAINTKSELQVHVDKRSNRRWWKSRCKWGFVCLIPVAFLYLLARWWFLR